MATAIGAAARRDTTIIGIIGVAHTFSHFFQLALPPLFPLIRAETGLSFTSLGILMGVFYATSGILQTPAGFLVDRVGARPVLFGGLALLAAATAGYGFAPTYEIMLALAVVAGIGNSVFHPADYSLINETVSASRTGRAYSVHSVGGHVGYAAAPPIMVALGALLGWHNAVIAVGIFGIVLTVVLLAMSDSLRPVRAAADSRSAPPETVRRSMALLLQPRIVTYFLFFFAFAFAIIGLQNFSPAALSPLSGLPFVTTSAILTAFLIGSPVGILIGGVLADALPRHALIATAGFALAGLLMLAVPLVLPYPPLLFAAFALAGLSLGISLPSRDMVVRAATPPGGSGKVFGFVYSGLDSGAAVGPALFGWFVDIGRPELVFMVAAALFFAGAMLIRLPALLFGRTAGASAGG